VLLADAQDIASHVTPLGSVILSGFTMSRVDDIAQRYTALGLVETRRIETEGWFALQMQRIDER